MAPLSIWQMLWELGTFCCVAVPTVVLVGMVIYAISKPLNYLDAL